MLVDKARILEVLHSRGDGNGAERADRELPDRVDPDEHAGLLGELGVDPMELSGQLGGFGLGG